MALLKRMPSQAQIESLVGILDFYYYKGLACVRSWPCKPTNTLALKRTHDNLRRGTALWKSTLEIDLEPYTFAVNGSELINRDMFMMNVLKMGSERSLITVNSVVLIGDYIYVNFDLLQGLKPTLSVNWLDDEGSSAYVTWLKGYKRTRGYPFGKKDIPTFNTGYFKSISWLNGHGFVIFRNRFRVLYFHFVDPTGVINFCSGVYHYDFRV